VYTCHTSSPPFAHAPPASSVQPGRTAPRGGTRALAVSCHSIYILRCVHDFFLHSIMSPSAQLHPGHSPPPRGMGSMGAHRAAQCSTSGDVRPRVEPREVGAVLQPHERAWGVRAGASNEAEQQMPDGVCWLRGFGHAF
jgi:hypothetical protein